MCYGCVCIEDYTDFLRLKEVGHKIVHYHNFINDIFKMS